MAVDRATPAATGRPRRPGGRHRSALIATALVVVVVVAGAVVGVRAAGIGTHASDLPRLCAVDGTACVDLRVSAAAAPRWALLPIDARGRLRVQPGATGGDVAAGVVAYLDVTARGTVRVLARTTTTGGVLLDRRRTKVLQLSGVPDGADRILVRTDGVKPSADIAPPCTRGAAGECRDLRVSVRTITGTPSSAVVTRLLSNHRGLSAAAARRAGAAVSTELSARADAPARIAATIVPGDGRLRVDWVLSAGGEAVTSVRVSLRPQGAGAPDRTDDAIAATGSLVLPGLDRATRYIVDVAPVVLRGSEHVVGAPVELSAIPNGQRTSAGPIRPSTPPGWKPLIQEGFDRPAALGAFADVYPAWSWYDGMTETSRETARPRSQVGVWRSATTTSVRNGMLDCHLWTKGRQPQVCAITPTPDGSIWHGQLYGRYSVRFKADRVPGYKIAWLLWPDSDDWTRGEVDFPEASLDSTITGSTHRNDGDPSDFAYYFDTAQPLGGWHTATIDWEPGRLTFVLDGESWTTTAKAGLPTVPMRWTLQAETDIQDAAPDPAAEGDILIDWVAAWSRDR
ncbi:glycoside hydrolase family 16 protein [Amnibacterium kyonggiense]|uniref:glycoside hydrolase family 16 protein n=1 Tax=Amnibacterium kyonggiense TaxID=595671 RepID=UPI00105B3F18|nr:glycoside hydrolase family 16 protein [Amnibacterium kyonggiense]